MTRKIEVEMSDIICANCHEVFSVPTERNDRWRETGESFRCPMCNGSQSYTDSSNKRLRDEIARLERWLKDKREYASSLYEQLEASRRSNAALRGVITKMRKAESK